MATDHEYRQKLFNDAAREAGLDKDEKRQLHDALQGIWERKDTMTYREVLEMAKGFKGKSKDKYK